jgi:predicted O-methyltransferase YrrM
MHPDYTYTQNWFYTSELYYALNRLVPNNTPIQILEIGSLEGSSATFFSDNVMDHPDATLTCCDPFDGKNPTTPQDESETKKLFLENTAKSKNGSKITLKQMFSQDFYKINDKTFDFIYIDGSHLVPDIQHDFVECLKIINKGGIIWMDDYLWGDGTTIRDAINKLYEDHKDQVKIIHKRYQIGFCKI